MTDGKSFWFEAKRYGIGWTLPVTWQGWTVVLAYFALLVAGLALIETAGYRLPYILGITLALVLIVVVKGEKPFRWRWGRGDLRLRVGHRASRGQTKGATARFSRVAGRCHGPLDAAATFRGDYSGSWNHPPVLTPTSTTRETPRF